MFGTGTQAGRRSVGLTRVGARLATGAVVVAGLLAVPAVASAHEERPARFPDGSGTVPSYRPYPADNRIVACRPDSAERISGLPTAAARERNRALLDGCRFGSIQDAVNAVERPNSTIYVLPGVYHETKYARSEPSGYCANLATESDDPLPDTNYIGSVNREQEAEGPAAPQEGDGQPVAISYADQLRCPHNLNLIAILGDRTPHNDSIRCDSRWCGLQIEGTGTKPGDVLVDNRFSKLNAIRADRAGGLYLRNFTVQQAEFNAVYVMESDGFVVDGLVTRANDEYGVLAFASDHGVIENSEAYYNGDSGLYPGSASDVNANNESFEPTRYSIVVRDNRMHHNALGYSGTAGNSVYAHDNLIWDNATGIATDSLFPDHPGLPQDHARFSGNRIWSNNVNYYARHVRTGDCQGPFADRGYLQGVVCPVIPVPVGTGLLIAGGNYNSTDHNRIYDNWRFGTMQFWVPAPLRNEYDPSTLYDTSHHNHATDNVMGITPEGAHQPNGLDFWWDDEGEGNCWQDNRSSAGEPTTNFTVPPPSCAEGGSLFTPGTSAVKDAGFLSCSQYNREDEFWRDPPGCEWFQSPERPTGSQGAAAGLLTQPRAAVLAAPVPRGAEGAAGMTALLGGLALVLAARFVRRMRSGP